MLSYTSLYPVRRTLQGALHFNPPPPGRPVPLHFTLGRPVPLYFTPAYLFLYTSPLADLFLYTSSTGRPVPLHFTPWQTCSFTLHPLADLFLYTSSTGRPVPLHFTPGRPVHSITNSTSLGSIEPRCNYYAKTIRSHIHHCLFLGIIYTAE